MKNISPRLIDISRDGLLCWGTTFHWLGHFDQGKERCHPDDGPKLYKWFDDMNVMTYNTVTTTRIWLRRATS